VSDEPGNGGARERDLGLDAGSRLPAEDLADEETPEADATEAPVRSERRMKTILILPSLITLGSTFCGFLAIAYVADALRLQAAGEAERAFMLMGRAGYLIFLAMIFDALDGRVARMSHVTTEFGGQLDSLSDAISFGVAPAFIAKGIIGLYDPAFVPKLTLFVSVVFVACAVLRLARYNVEHDNLVTGLDEFRGLPSPGAAGGIAVAAILCAEYPDAMSGVVKGLPILTFVLAILMVSRFPYVHAMNRFLRGRKPFTFLLLIVIIVAFGLTQGFEILAAVLIGLYLLSGPVNYLVGRLTGKRGEEALFD
jgi:CDP-diacylglycerol--serine O-phosphatidyltransferase